MSSKSAIRAFPLALIFLSVTLSVSARPDVFFTMSDVLKYHNLPVGLFPNVRSFEPRDPEGEATNFTIELGQSCLVGSSASESSMVSNNAVEYKPIIKATFAHGRITNIEGVTFTISMMGFNVGPIKLSGVVKEGDEFQFIFAGGRTSPFIHVDSFDKTYTCASGYGNHVLRMA